MWGGFGGPMGARTAGRLGLGLQSIDPDLLDEYLAGLDAGGHDPTIWPAWRARSSSSCPMTPSALGPRSPARDLPVGLPQTCTWSDYPGIAEELIDRHLDLTFTEVAPLLRQA